MNPPESGFTEYKKLFEHLIKQVEMISEQIGYMREDIASLKVKASVFGFVSGALGAILVWISRTFF